MLFDKVKVERLATHTGTLPFFPSEHLLFTVRGSSGKLRVAWYGQKKDASPDDMYDSAALLLNDIPLIHIQSSGCPTCESLLAAGYSLPENSGVLSEIRSALEKPYCGLDDALNRLRPVLGLLAPGIYILSYSAYCPTDGDSHFFWNVPEEMTAYRATSAIYESENYRMLPAFPCYFYPTQDAIKYNPHRAQYYRQQLQAGRQLPPVLSYSLWGYMSALLDGHHRACACAQAGGWVPCLTISRAGLIWRNEACAIAWPDGSEIAVSQVIPDSQRYLLEQQSSKEAYNPPQAASNMRFYQAWDVDYIGAARRYPTCHDVGILALYPNVELNAKGLHRLAMDEDYEDPSSAAHLLWYASQQPGIDAKALGMAFIAPGYPLVLRQTAYQVLDQIKDDSEIDDLMVDVLINCERKDDPIYQIANGHWDERKK